MEKAITSKDIINDEGLHKEIISDFTKKFVASDTYMSSKRENFKEWFNMYLKPESYKDNIVKIHTVHRQMKWFISTFYDSELTVEFSPAEFGDDEYAYKLTKNAEYDNRAMQKNVKDFMHFRNLWFYGVALRVLYGYDKTKKIPIYRGVNPKHWLPDPNGNIIDGFGWHFFYTTYTDEQIESVNRIVPGTYFNIDKITKGNNNVDAHADEASERLLSTTLRDSDIYSTIDGSYEYKWRKYLITVASGNQTIIRWQEIKPVDKTESSNPHLIPHTVSVSNVFPLENDCCGVWYAELSMSYQTAINKLTNQSLIREWRRAWFDHILVDVNRLQNIDLLSERSNNGPVFIPVSSNNGPVSGITWRVVDDSWVDGNTMGMIDRLDLNSQYDTAQTNASSWLSDPNSTLGQSQQQQINLNIWFGLDSEVISFGEVDFWKNIRFRTLKFYMNDYDEKTVRIGSGLASTTLRLKRNDFLSWSDPDINIINKRFDKAKKKETMAYMVAREPFIMNDPSIPEISKKLYRRELDRLNDVPRERIYLNTPMTGDERRAIDYMYMINAKVEPKSLFRPWMDLFTYYIYISWCEDSDLKHKVLIKLEEAMMNEWLNKQQIPPESQQQNMSNSIGNANASAMTSNYIKNQLWWQSKIASRADISALW